MYGVGGSYEQRCAGLADAGVAVWDVLRQSVRPGSLDADIRLDSAETNDFRSFFRHHTALRRVCFNGKTAASLFRRRVMPELGTVHCEFVTLPSTSPTHAALRFEQKLAIWRRHLLVE